jgi:hypothetical protein
MNADGTGQTNLTNNSALDGAASWSPDETQIAFTTNRDGNFEVYVMNADGSSPTNLTNNSAFDGAASWSPDGSKIAFNTTRDGNSAIYVMNADGSSPTNLANNAGEPAWSPDGTKIAFSSVRDGNFEIYVMNADGTGQTRITINSAVDFEPAWQWTRLRVVNDMFADATELTGISDTDTGSNLGATGEPGEPSLFGDTLLNSVWWKWTAPASGQVTIDTIGSDFDTNLAVYTGSAVDALTEIASNDDIQSPASFQSQVSFFATEGTTYYIAVDGFGQHTYNITLNLALSPYPKVQSIARSSPDTALSTVIYTVTFSEAVTGVDLSDFRMVTTGSISRAKIVSVTGSGATYQVTVNTGRGSGAIRLDLVDNDSIKDLSNNPLVGQGGQADGSFQGEVYSFPSAKRRKR